MSRTTPNYLHFQPASARTTAAARGASRKSDTKPELLLRRALWRRGLRYRKNAADLPGRPDIVFRSARLAVFCDGDFWHGADWESRKAKLAQGHNAAYWVAKIERNRARDAEVNKRLRSMGWRPMRLWESAIRADAEGVADQVEQALRPVAVATPNPNPSAPSSGSENPRAGG